MASAAGAGGDRAFRVEPGLVEVKPNHFVARSAASLAGAMS
jgi:peptide/nickel transport system ATP-binding protein